MARALARARELAAAYLKAPEVTRRNNAGTFYPALEGAHRERGGLRPFARRCLGGGSGQAMQAKAQPAAEKEKVA